MSFYLSLPFAQEYTVLTYIRWILILSSGYESCKLCKMITRNQAHSWLLSRFKGSYFFHNLSFVCLKLFILCKKKKKKCQYSAEASIISLDMYYVFIPLSILKSANKRRSLLLFATSILTMSGGLFWFATKSCSTGGENQ
jgi:hypothetical protein